MPIVINRGQNKLLLSFIDLSFISYELQPILDKRRWIMANWWYLQETDEPNQVFLL